MITHIKNTPPAGKLSNFLDGCTLLSLNENDVTTLRGRITTTKQRWSSLTESRQKALLHLGWFPLNKDGVMFLTE